MRLQQQHHYSHGIGYLPLLISSKFTRQLDQVALLFKVSFAISRRRGCGPATHGRGYVSIETILAHSSRSERYQMWRHVGCESAVFHGQATLPGSAQAPLT